MGEETGSALYDDAAERSFEARIEALTACRELLDRERRGEAQPGDKTRLLALRDQLERCGGVPPALLRPPHR